MNFDGFIACCRQEFPVACGRVEVHISPAGFPSDVAVANASILLNL